MLSRLQSEHRNLALGRVRNRPEVERIAQDPSPHISQSPLEAFRVCGLNFSIYSIT
jgi:hypothetical protein